MSAPSLSEREQQVADELVRDGASNRTIGRRLGISEDTVKSHVKAILRKTGAANRTAAANLLGHQHDGRQVALAPILALIQAAQRRPDCRYAIAGVGEKVLIDIDELRRAVVEAEAAP